MLVFDMAANWAIFDGFCPVTCHSIFVYIHIAN